jgi:hypothetical protein
MALGLRHGNAAVGLTLLAGLSAAGCGGSDPEKELRKVASWAATAHLVADARVAGSVSARYATQILVAAVQQLDEESRSLRTAQLDPLLRSEALETTSALRQVIGAMPPAAEGDLATLAHHRTRLEALERQAKALSRSARQQ